MDSSKTECLKSQSSFLGKEDLQNATFPSCLNKERNMILKFLLTAWTLTVKLKQSGVKSHFGSGLIVDVQLTSDLKCNCSLCSGQKKLGSISVKTAFHVVCDDEEEVKNTTCSLFYDSKDSRGIVLKGSNIVESNKEKDKCTFQCYTCDENLLIQLSDTLNNFNTYKEDIRDKFGMVREEDMIAVVVSHPHGGPKKCSIGPCKFEFNDGGYVISYQAATSPGSSGAPVLVIGGQRVVVHSKKVNDLGVSSELTSSESEGEDAGLAVASC